MPEEPADAQEEADDQIRADRAIGGQADGAEQGGHSQRPEDESDGASDQAYHAAGSEGCRARIPSARAWSANAEQEVDAAPEEGGRDSAEQQALGDASAEKPAHESGHHRSRRHPRDDAPFDAPGARVGKPSRGGGRCADGDIRPGSGCRTARPNQDDGKSQAPEHEADDAPEEAGDERAARG